MEKRALSLKEAASAQAFRLNREGFLELRRANGRNELMAVHADRRESDLDVIPKETLALWQGTGRAGGPGGPGAPAAQPYSLWWYLASHCWWRASLNRCFLRGILPRNRRRAQQYGAKLPDAIFGKESTMNPLDSVNAYLKSLEQRLRWTAITRGSAITAIAALAATDRAGACHQFLCVLDPSFVSRACCSFCVSPFRLHSGSRSR